MSQVPPERRRRPSDNYPRGDRPGAHARNSSGKKQKGGRKKSRAVITLCLIVFLGLLAVIVIVSPKTHLGRATYSTGTSSGLVESGANDESAYYSGLVISEIMPANKTSVPDENGEYNDWIELWNNSGHDINMENVGLSDASDSIKFLFPAVTLKADERLIVYCSGKNQAEVGKNLHAKFKLSSNGETIYLYQPSAYLIDSATYRVMGTDTVWARQ